MPGNKKSKPRKAVKPSHLKQTSTLSMALTKEQHDFLKRVPHEALALFKAGQGDQTSWFNMGFRLQTALNLADKYYTVEAGQGMREAFAAIRTMRTSFHKTGVWAVTTVEAGLLEMGLEAADQMQMEMLRRDMLEASRQAQTFMKAYANEEGPKLHP